MEVLAYNTPDLVNKVKELIRQQNTIVRIVVTNLTQNDPYYLIEYVPGLDKIAPDYENEYLQCYTNGNDMLNDIAAKVNVFTEVSFITFSTEKMQLIVKYRVRENTRTVSQLLQDVCITQAWQAEEWLANSQLKHDFQYQVVAEICLGFNANVYEANALIQEFGFGIPPNFKSLKEYKQHYSWIGRKVLKKLSYDIDAIDDDLDEPSVLQNVWSVNNEN